jgi:hypothetical protein
LPGLYQVIDGLPAAQIEVAHTKIGPVRDLQRGSYLL